MKTYERITDPGKFEGELSIVPKMWDLVLEGLSADVYFGEGETYSFVCLLAVDEPVNEGLYGACLWERSDGFVCSKWFETEGEYKAELYRLEKEAEKLADEEISAE